MNPDYIAGITNKPRVALNDLHEILAVAGDHASARVREAYDLGYAEATERLYNNSAFAAGVAEGLKRAEQAVADEARPYGERLDQPMGDFWVGVVLDAIPSRPYTYVTNDPSITHGTRVRVPVGDRGGAASGIVQFVWYNRPSVPKPIKRVLRTIS